ncbi:MAG: Uma2 family endonuclease [Gemmataceae bacterium]
MATETPTTLLTPDEYERAAQEYLRRLKKEHFMESTAQATQRKITLESLDLVRARRPEVQVFNELLVQYLPTRGRKLGQVVPDNLVVLWPRPLAVAGSFDLEHQPTRPFWVLEYVSKSNRRKDYEQNFRRYEKELTVPYYLLFYPDNQELTLYRHNGRKYVSVPPDDVGRHPIPELELEIGLLDGWVRYWFRGELLPLPAELLASLDEAREQLDEAWGERDKAVAERDALQQQLKEIQRQREEMAGAGTPPRPAPAAVVRRMTAHGRGAGPWPHRRRGAGRSLVTTAPTSREVGKLARA